MESQKPENFIQRKDKVVNGPKKGIKDMDYEIRGQNTILGNCSTNS